MAHALTGVAGQAGRADDLAADAMRLRSMRGSDYTPDDGRRLRELVEAGPAELTEGLPRQLADGTALETHIGVVVDRPAASVTMGTVGKELDRFLASWRHSLLSDAERAAVVTRLQRTPADEYTPDDWIALDAAISARPPHTLPDALPGASDRAGRLAATGARGYGDVDTARTMQRYLDAWRVGDMTPAEVAQEAGRLRSLPTGSWTTRDWAMLDALNGSGSYASRIDIPRKLATGSELERLLPYYRSGQWTRPEDEMLRYLAAWRAQSMTDDELREATRSIVARDPATFEQGDWRALQAVVDANGLRGNPLRMPTSPQFEHGPDLQALLASELHGPVRYHPDAVRHHFATWMPRLDRTWEARAREAMRTAARGETASFEPNMPTAIAQQQDGDIWRLTGREQVRLAVALLRHGELSSSPVVATPLQLLSSGLDDVAELEPQLLQLRDDTAGLVEHNLGVIEGRVQGSGYGNHPDYAHIGRITENVALIEQVISTPHVAAPPRIDPEAGKLTEVLEW